MVEILTEAWAEIAHNPLLFLIEVIQFAVLVVIIAYGGRKIIGGYLSRRRDRIAADVAEAAKGREALAYAKSEAKAIVAEAVKDAKNIVRQAKAEAKKSHQSAQAKADEEAALIIRQAGETIEAEKREIAEESSRQFVELVPILARRFIEEELAESDRRVMIQNIILSGLKELKTAGT
ncbi:MAG: ATP synthase F0 subunit B [Actinomycetota bacterium]